MSPATMVKNMTEYRVQMWDRLTVIRSKKRLTETLHPTEAKQ